MTTEDTLPVPDEEIKAICKQLAIAHEQHRYSDLPKVIMNKVNDFAAEEAWGGLYEHQWPINRYEIQDNLKPLISFSDENTVRGVARYLLCPHKNATRFTKMMLLATYNTLLQELDIPFKMPEQKTPQEKMEILFEVTLRAFDTDRHAPKYNSDVARLYKQEMGVIHDALKADFAQHGSFKRWKSIARPMYEATQKRWRDFTSLFHEQIKRIEKFADTQVIDTEIGDADATPQKSDWTQSISPPQSNNNMQK